MIQPKQYEATQQDSIIHEPINLKSFMSLCDLHHSIIQQFKYSSDCIYNSVACLKGCPIANPQKQHKLHGHQSIKAKQFYSNFHVLRQNYFSIIKQMRQKIYPNFIKKVRQQINEFQLQIVKQLSSPVNFIQNLCRIGNNSILPLLQIINEKKVQNIELSQLRCKQVGKFKQLFIVLKHFQQNIKKQEKNLGLQHCRNQFSNFLLAKNIVSFINSGNTNNNEIGEKTKIPTMVQVHDIRQIPSKVLSLIKQQIGQNKQNKNQNRSQAQKGQIKQLKQKIHQIQTFNLKISFDIIELFDRIKANSQSNLAYNHKIKSLQQQIFISLNSLQAYLTKIKPLKIYISLKQLISQHSTVLDKNLLTDSLLKLIYKIVSLKQIVIYSTKKQQNQNQNDLENISYVEKQLKLYREKTKTNISQSVQWLGRYNYNQHNREQKQSNLINQNQKIDQGQILQLKQLYSEIKKLLN